MKKFALPVPVVIVAAVLVSGCATAPYDGTPPKADQGSIDTATASATAWLNGQLGRDEFPTGSLASVMPIFNDNRTIDHWIFPIKDDAGMYLGYFVSQNERFTMPLTAMRYPDPRHNLWSLSKDEAYSQMLSEHSYTSGQVKEPYVSVVAGKGYMWTSEVVINGKKANVLYVPISTINPSDADNRLKTPA